MYIEKIKIDKFRVLEDIEIHFQPPGGATADPETGNVVNIIAGVNGSGKTSILEYIAFLGEEDNISLDKELKPIGDFSVFYLPVSLELTYEKEVNNVKNDLSNLKIPVGRFGGIVYRLDSNGLLSKAERFIKEFIVNAERKSHESDPDKRRFESARKFNLLFSDVNLNTVFQDLSGWENANRPVFKNYFAENITIDQLSDGEKQLYGRIIGLMSLNPKNSIILIDEPEVALHPAWQQKIMQIYSRIGENNQFIVATHSPQIIASVPYKNRILLRKENGKIQPVHMSQPPSGVDVNSILSEIMGADPRPPELLKLYAEYRKFVEERKENTSEALKVKAQLSEESDHSQFMQEMNFLIDLRDL